MSETENFFCFAAAAVFLEAFWPPKQLAAEPGDEQGAEQVQEARRRRWGGQNCCRERRQREHLSCRLLQMCGFVADVVLAWGQGQRQRGRVMAGAGIASGRGAPGRRQSQAAALDGELLLAARPFSS